MKTEVMYKKYLPACLVCIGIQFMLILLINISGILTIMFSLYSSLFFVPSPLF